MVTSTDSSNGSGAAPVATTSNNQTPQILSTLPGPNHNWQITLEGKVIASKSMFQSFFFGC